MTAKIYVVISSEHDFVKNNQISFQHEIDFGRYRLKDLTIYLPIFGMWNVNLLLITNQIYGYYLT